MDLVHYGMTVPSNRDFILILTNVMKDTAISQVLGYVLRGKEGNIGLIKSAILYCTGGDFINETGQEWSPLGKYLPRRRPWPAPFFCPADGGKAHC